MNRSTMTMIVVILTILLWDLPLYAGLPDCRLLSAEHHPASTSIHLSLHGSPDYESFYLKHPDRFILDIKNTYYEKVSRTITPDSPVIETVRISQFQPDIVRVVLDQKAPALVSISKKDAIDGSVIVLKSRSADLMTGTHKESADPDLDSLFGVPDLDDTPSAVHVSLNDASISDKISPQMSITGEFRQKSAYRLSKPHQFSTLKNTLNARVSGSLSKNLSYVLSARVSYDPIFDLTENYNDQVEDDQRVRKDLRDAYVDFGLGNFDFRLGNQQIVWGQAVGLFFGDIVNPLDLREFILPDLEQIRIPVPAANMEYYHDNLYFQMIFIPFPEFNEFGEPGSEFDFTRNLLHQDADIVLNPPTKPGNSLNNSEIGFRTSIFTRGWNLSAFYLYDQYNFPVNYRMITMNPLGSQHPVTITHMPEYERIHRYGTTFSKNVGDAIVKGEFLYSSRMFFQTSDPTFIQGIDTSDTFDWLIGLDYTFFEKVDTNFQFMQNIILDHNTSMAVDQFTTAFSFWIQTGFFQNKLEPELFFIARLEQTDYMFRPKIIYNHTGSLKLTLGADIFKGDPEGNFGIFDKNDRFYTELIYSF